MKKTARKRNDKGKNKENDPRRVSHLVKPASLTLEQWQVQLRRQAARDENFGITQLDDDAEPGYFEVTTTGRGATGRRAPLRPHTRKVVYRGVDSPWNFCSCLDFKTTALGTCKHIEAVKLWLDDNNKRPSRAVPPRSVLYIDYRAGRRIRLRLGSENLEQMLALTQHYFNGDGFVKPGMEGHLHEFILKAHALSESFKCFPDVYEAIESAERLAALRAIEQSTSDDDLQHLLKTTLLPYQIEGVRFAFSRGRSIIADEMGLGKTVQAIATAEWMRKTKLITTALILCPTSLKYQWKFEIERFTSQQALVIEGNAAQRRAQYNSTEAFYKIVSYNAMSNDVRYGTAVHTDLLILDEVQRLKNWDTNIARATRDIESLYTVILSGTPLENKLEDLYSIVELVDQYLLAPYYRFRNDHIVIGPTGMATGYRNLGDVAKRIKGVLLRRRKRDVALQLPKRIDKTIYVEMTPEQHAVHADCMMQLSVILHRWEKYHYLSDQDRMRLLKLLNLMRMAANSTYLIDQTSRNDTKVDEVLSIVDSIIDEGDEKVVIFSCWERMTRLIASELDKRGIGYANLNGSVPSAKRRTLIESFNNDPDCRVFISTDAGATGLNLQSASVVINIELPWNPAVLEQRIGRIYRMGQKRTIQVINFVSLDSFERQIEQKLKFKQSLFDGILDDGNDEVWLSDKSRMQQLIETVAEAMPPEPDDDAPQEKTNGTSEPQKAPAATEAEQADKPQTPETLPTAPVSKATKATETPETHPISETTETTAPTAKPAATPPADIVAETSQTQSSPQSQSSQQPQSSPQSQSAQQTQSSPQSQSSEQTQSSPQSLINQGVSFLTGLAQTLRDPAKTAALVDTLVKTDKDTGRTTINIPVPDKKTVSDLLGLFGALLNR